MRTEEGKLHIFVVIDRTSKFVFVELHDRATRSIACQFLRKLIESVRAGHILLADRAYDSNALRQTLKNRGAFANVRAMPHRLDPPAFSPFLYRQRNAVERFFSKLKHFRAIATRYDKRDDNFLASIKLASLRIWLRFNESVT